VHQQYHGYTVHQQCHGYTVHQQYHGYTVHQQYPTLYFPTVHTTLKNVELLKHFKISKIAPTCFGLQGNHHQGATVST